MRPSNRAPMPDLDRVLREANEVLSASGLAPCESLQPMADEDTANPNVVGLAGERRWAIKVCLRFPERFEQAARLANRLAELTGLPIPRHYCGERRPDRLPLVVMEWMPGEQLRLLLPSLAREEARELAADLGRCLARLHTAVRDAGSLGNTMPLKDDHAGFVRGLRLRAEQDTRRLAASGLWQDAELRRLGEWLGARKDGLAAPALRGLTKPDLDVRDFLAQARPRPHISAMLDWEDVMFLDCLWNLASIRVRLHLMGLADLWPSFLDGYAASSAARPRPSPAADFYLMARAMIPAGSGNPLGAELVRLLLSGEGAGWLDG